MMTDEQDFERQYRKNLMIISSVMLVYSVAGGSIGGEISLSGVAIKFKNSNYLDWLGFVIMYFLWWRHWLVSTHIRKEMMELVIQEGVLSKRSVRKIIEAFLPGKNISISPNGVGLTPRNRYEYVVGFGNGHSALAELRFDTVVPTKVFFGCGIIKVINGLQGDVEYTKDAAYKIPSGMVKLYVLFDYWKWFFYCALRYPSFGDGLLPSLIVAVSTVLFLINKI